LGFVKTKSKKRSTLANDRVFLAISLTKTGVCRCCGSDGVNWPGAVHPAIRSCSIALWIAAEVQLDQYAALDQAGPSECGNLFRFVLFCDLSHQFLLWKVALGCGKNH